ncbi:TonB-dependent receptor [Actinobacillus equuli]|uniref:TonB-dependent receptor n=1 Tax=Actinobacillus equuli TaxID=718 RepID=UPI002442657C|nr:TonB-dependent receptor [Actinobacillus equuli]WGE57580.1 TonB-dependent receptor [Actinobacillus equuli subsp. equuli]
MKKNAITVALFTLLSLTAQAEERIELEEVKVNARGKLGDSVLNNADNISDQVVDKSQLKHRSATLGNALAGELGIHSNPFGGGASKPIIRGQDGVRVKILQNGTDVIDMSSLSPDHVVAADTLLASQVELVRGANTLLYSTASPAGVVNVVDGRIPTQMPTGSILPNLEGEALVRYNTASKEVVNTAGITLGLGNHFALRLEGLKRNADNYRVPKFQAESKQLNYLPGSDNKSNVGTIGLSYIHDKGYLGASYSYRKDRYSIPGHIHCNSDKEHFTQWYGSGRYYLSIYPHLMGDEDIYDNPHTHCRHNHNEPSEDNPTGILVNHLHDSPYILMNTKRYDVRGELLQPFKWLDKAKLSLTFADYYHDERDPGNPQTQSNPKSSERSPTVDKNSENAIFKNKGFNSRLELYHAPTKHFKGLVGLQYQTQKASAGEVLLPSYFESPEAYSKALQNNVNSYRPYLLVPHTNKSLSLFGLEQFNLGKFSLDTAIRYEKQRTPVHYEQKLLNHALNSLQKDPSRPKVYSPIHPDLTPYKQNALSYAATTSWDFTPENRLSLSYSHNERIPSPMELYYQGRHLATSSFEHGNKDLTKEKSDNYELAFRHTGDKVFYKTSGYYSDFDNYIFNENVEKEGNLYLRRYNQTTAKFYGLEAEVTYQFHPDHSITLFGDIVRGRIGKLSPVIGKNFYDKDPILDEENINADCLLGGGDLSQCVGFTNKDELVAPPIVSLDPSCSKDDIKEAPEYCVLTYPGKIGTDKLERPATNAPRVPPVRLGFRWQGYFDQNWSANLEYIHVFTQKRVSTSTIAIKPRLHTPKGCTRDDSDCEIKNYVNNNLPMVARKVTENKTQGYNLLNLGIDYNRIIKNVDYTFSLRANNVLNEQIYIHNSFLPYVPQIGRNFTFAVNVKF